MVVFYSSLLVYQAGLYFSPKFTMFFLRAFPSPNPRSWPWKLGEDFAGAKEPVGIARPEIFASGNLRFLPGETRWNHWFYTRQLWVWTVWSIHFRGLKSWAPRFDRYPWYPNPGSQRSFRSLESLRSMPGWLMLKPRKKWTKYTGTALMYLAVGPLDPFRVFGILHIPETWRILFSNVFLWQPWLIPYELLV